MYLKFKNIILSRARKFIGLVERAVTERLHLMIVLVLVMLALLVWFYPSNSDFKSENPHWNGTIDFLEDIDAQVLYSYDLLPPEAQDTTLIVIPYIELSPDDLKMVDDYVNSGGRLLLMDDFGFGNGILEYLGLNLRFTGAQVLDPLLDYKNRNFPKVIDFSDASTASEIDSLVFNHATSLSDTSTVDVVAWSSYFSFLDENQNGQWDEGEPKGHLPVIAEFSIGEGELFVISDPSILISSMLDMEDNRQFLENIIQGQVFFDQAHLPDATLDEAKVVLKVTRRTMATVWGTLGLIALVLILTLKPIRNAKIIKIVK